MTLSEAYKTKTCKKDILLTSSINPTEIMAQILKYVLVRTKNIGVSHDGYRA